MLKVQQIAVFGEVLFDRFPDGTHMLGGAPFNVAWHLQALQQLPCLISRVGCDQAGQQIMQAMEAWGMTTCAIQRDDAHPSGAVEITLIDGEPDYAILAEQAYDFIAADSIDLNAGWFYHGSLALRHPVSRAAWQFYRQAHPGKVFVDLNLRPPWWHPSLLALIMAGADWLKLNVHELEQLVLLGTSQRTKIEYLLQQYQLSGVFLTQGAAGAELYTAAGDFFSVRPDKATPVLDSVGAGDAFAAVCLLGLMQEWSYPVILERAQQLASAVVARRGAVITEPDYYQRYRQDWNL